LASAYDLAFQVIFGFSIFCGNGKIKAISALLLNFCHKKQENQNKEGISLISIIGY